MNEVTTDRAEAPECFPARINISYQISGAVLDAVQELNRHLVRERASEIAFRPSGQAVPHMTLLMGIVKNEADFHKMCGTLGDEVANLEPLQFSISEPYRPGPKSGFVFMDVLARGRVRSQRFALGQALGSLMHWEHNGRPDNRTHITIGYSTDLEQRDLDVLQRVSHLTGTAEVVQVGRVGRRGTLVDVFRSFTLE